MSTRKKGPLENVVEMLARHLQAVSDRQAKRPTAEMEAADMASVTRAAELLQAIEYDRTMLVLKLLGRQLATMTTDELVNVFNKTIVDSDTENEPGTN